MAKPKQGYGFRLGWLIKAGLSTVLVVVVASRAFGPWKPLPVRVDSRVLVAVAVVALVYIWSDRAVARGLTAVLGAVGFGAAARWATLGPDRVTRTAWALVVACVLIFFVATEWAPRAFVAAVAGIAVVCALLISGVGRIELNRRSLSDAGRTLEEFATQKTALAAQQIDQLTEAQRQAEKAIAGLTVAEKDVHIAVTSSAATPCPKLDEASKQARAAVAVEDDLTSIVCSDTDLRWAGAIAALNTANNALKAADTALATRVDPKTLDPLQHTLTQATCAIDSIAKSRKADKTETGGTNAERIEVRRLVRVAQVQLVQLRAEVTGAEADKKDLAALRTTATDPVPEENITTVDALVAGGQRLLEGSRADLSKPFGDSSSRTVALRGPLAWAAIALALIGLLLWMLRRTAHQLPGPIHLDDHDAIFRIALLQNLTEPGIVPGAEALAPVTDMLATSPSLATTKKLVEIITTYLQKVWKPGYRVSIDRMPEKTTKKPAEAATADSALPAAFSVRSGPVPTVLGTAAPTEKPMSHCGLVRVSLASSGAMVGSKNVQAESTEALSRTAGLWAAGLILSRSPRVPSWASWNEDTAHGVSAVLEPSPSVERLEEAVRAAPSSGMLLVHLGNAYELAGRRLDALSVYGRAVQAHPRYLAARYRLAGALNMADHELIDEFLRAAIDEPTRTAMRRTWTWDGEPVAEPDASDLKGFLQQWFRDQARGHFWRLAWRTSWLGVLFSSLRRDERISWTQPGAWSRRRYRALSIRTCISIAAGDKARPVLIQWAHRHCEGEGGAWQQLAKSQRWCDNWVQDLHLKHVERIAHRYSTNWNVSYNLACLNSRRGEYPKALILLERCVTQPGVEALSRQWLERDNDLKHLQQQPRFIALKDCFREEED